MAVTLLELRNRVRERIGLPSDDEFITDAVINQEINNALEAMAADFDWPWLQVVSTFNTVANQQAYDLPTGATRVQVAYVKSDMINGYDMPARNFKFIVQMLNTQPSMPSDFAIVGNQIYLGPTPDGVYTITLLYIQDEATLSSDSDTCLCPEPYSEMIVIYACLNLSMRMQDMTRFNMFMPLKKDWVERVSQHVVKSATPPAVVQRDDF